jgi:hypothetical protein
MDLGSGDRAEVEFSIVPFSQTVNSVCETCNNRWMSNVETDAHRTLKSVLVGQARDIHN